MDDKAGLSAAGVWSVSLVSIVDGEFSREREEAVPWNGSARRNGEGGGLPVLVQPEELGLGYGGTSAYLASGSGRVGSDGGSRGCWKVAKKGEDDGVRVDEEERGL